MKIKKRVERLRQSVVPVRPPVVRDTLIAARAYRRIVIDSPRAIIRHGFGLLVAALKSTRTGAFVLVWKYDSGSADSAY
jgi:hypothetical protein